MIRYDIYVKNNPIKYITMHTYHIVTTQMCKIRTFNLMLIYPPVGAQNKIMLFTTREFIPNSLFCNFI